MDNQTTIGRLFGELPPPAEELALPLPTVEPIAVVKPADTAPTTTPSGPPGIPARAPTIAAAPAALAEVAGAPPAPEIYLNCDSVISRI